ncbi:hypothetical protein GCM10009001_19750 [Virgibacillus siamensis]|uniref:Uncharacterized protein n=1 Tax=Virgibacillus siamensis TaxID=480071 RepID=A0ABN1G2J5_9BACI
MCNRAVLSPPDADRLQNDSEHIPAAWSVSPALDFVVVSTNTYTKTAIIIKGNVTHLFLLSTSLKKCCEAKLKVRNK